MVDQVTNPDPQTDTLEHTKKRACTCDPTRSRIMQHGWMPDYNHTFFSDIFSGSQQFVRRQCCFFQLLRWVLAADIAPEVPEATSRR